MENVVFWDVALTEVSEEHIAPTFRVDKTANEEPE
jgi:hypothetical protein